MLEDAGAVPPKITISASGGETVVDSGNSGIDVVDSTAGAPPVTTYTVTSTGGPSFQMVRGPCALNSYVSNEFLSVATQVTQTSSIEAYGIPIPRTCLVGNLHGRINNTYAVDFTFELFAYDGVSEIDLNHSITIPAGSQTAVSADAPAEVTEGYLIAYRTSKTGAATGTLQYQLSFEYFYVT